MNFLFLNGQILPTDQAAVSPLDQGLTTGYGIFETIRVVDFQPCLFDLHFERLTASATKLELEPPSEATLRSAINQLLEKNQMNDARVRITLTGGVAPFPNPAESSTLLITAVALPEFPKSASVLTVPFTQSADNAMSGMKSISYGSNVVALQYAQRRGADEAIINNSKGYLCEGATTNIFVIIDGQIQTPKLSSGCLPGTMRRAVLDFAKNNDIEIIETDISLADRKPDFAFLTSSLRGVQAIHQFDNAELPIEHPIIDKLRSTEFL